MPDCAVSHCNIPASARTLGSLCAPHYQLKWRGQDPETRKVRPSGKTDAICWVEDCPKRVETKQLCSYHGRRARTGRLQVPPELGVKVNDPCMFEGCDRPYSTKKLCHSHYSQLQEGRESGMIRDYGKYTKGEHVCGVSRCKKVAVSSGLCINHKGLQSQYKITPERMIAIWGNPRCENPGCDVTTRLHMDHDHSTGEFRGLLCNGCNTALGFLKESPDRIRGILSYLERFIDPA